MKNEQQALLQSFITKVKKQIKSKEAQDLVEHELSNHIGDRSEMYQKDGYTKEQADKQAIQGMGNPITLGKEMNQLHRPKIDWTLVFLFSIIIGLSLIPMYTLSFIFDGLLMKKIVFSLMAVVVVICILLFDYRMLEKFGISMYISAVVMMLWISIIGLDFQGKMMWHIGGIRIDFMFSLLLLYLAWASILQHWNKYHKGMLHLLFWLPILLYLWNGYYFLSIVYFITVIILINIASVKSGQYRKFTWITFVFALVLSIVLFLSASPDQKGRFTAFLQPEQYKNTWGYQSSVARDMLVNAGWFGQGNLQGNLHEQVIRLPEAQTDFILPYLIYVFGWGGGLLLAVILFIFVIRIVQVAIKTNHPFGKLIVIGGLTIFLIALITNILMSFGFLPVVSISLPFISYGGIQLIFYSSIVGLVLSVYRRMTA